MKKMHYMINYSRAKWSFLYPKLHHKLKKLKRMRKERTINKKSRLILHFLAVGPTMLLKIEMILLEL